MISDSVIYRNDKALAVLSRVALPFFLSLSRMPLDNPRSKLTEISCSPVRHEHITRLMSEH